MTRSQRLLTALVVCLLLLGGGPIQLWQSQSFSRSVQAATDTPPLSSTPVSQTFAEQSNTTVAVPPAQPAAREPREIIELRTSHSKTFLNPDDQTYVARIWNAPIHYRDDQGRWQDTDNRLVASSSLGYLFENAANAFKSLGAGAGLAGLGYLAAGYYYPREWGWRYIQPRYGPTIEFPWYRGWR